MIPSYPKVYNLGHPELEHLFDDPVLVQEKVDGSQFSFGVIDHKLFIRSKGQSLVEDAIPTSDNKMFNPGIEYVAKLWAEGRIPNNHVFRGEFLGKAKHNTLAYDRVPKNHIILFDVEYLNPAGIWVFLSQAANIEMFARNLDLESVPEIEGNPYLRGPDAVREAMETVSCLGGQKIEGLVFKNHRRFGRDGKFLAGKHVSEAFKEVHRKDWKERNPGGLDIIGKLADEMRTPARWDKAVQHLAERGELQNAPQDIGPLMKEAAQDLQKEEEEYIKDRLFKWAWPKLQREVTRGLPQWYKDKLMESQFDG